MRIIKQSLVLCILLSLVLTACGTNKQTATQNLDEPKLGNEYPLKTDETLRFWSNGVVNAAYSSYKDQPLYQEIMKQTGVNIDFRFAPAGQGQEAFNLLIASNDLPDIILYDWLVLPGGPQKYIDEKYIIPLNEVLDKYAVNLSKYLSENSEIDRMIKTDKGQYYAFPFVRGDDWLTVYSGPVIRSDLLNKFNLSVPETMDEWYGVLKTFKNNGVDIPLTLLNTQFGFSSGTNAIPEFYVDNGKVKYGPIENEWKEYMKVIQKWYSEGLIDKDYGSLDSTVLTQKMTSGKVGATIGSGGNLGIWLPSGKKNNHGFDLIGTKYPAMQKGQTPKFGQKDNLYPGWGSSAITTQAKNVELAAKVLDYAYSPKGHMLYNFGIEGVSYKMVDGQPKFTPEMYDESGALVNINKYTWSITTMQSIQDKRMYEQRLVWQQQRDAIDTWYQTDAKKYKMPPITPQTDETQIVADVVNQLNTFKEEFFFSTVCSKEPFTDEKFDAYVQQVKNLGIDEVIKIYESALARYYSR